MGDTLPKIAAEKAGIIKARVPVVISQTQLEVISVFNNTAKELKAPVEFADKNFKILSFDYTPTELNVQVLNKKINQSTRYELDLKGSYQLKNLLGVLNMVEVLKQKGFMIEEKEVTAALKQVQKMTGLQGRWQVLSEKPLVIADTGHNEDGIKEVLELSLIHI